MSTRSNLAAVAAGAGVLALGWNIGTANSQTVSSIPATTQTSTTTTQQTTTQKTGQTTSGQTTTSQESTTQQSTTGSATSSTPSASATNSSGLKDGTYTGQTIQHHYGTVTVTVTISNGAISSLSENVQSDGDGHSERINSEAVPMIRDEVLSANSADVNTISGATFTTSAYLQSLQSALDQAK